jgi:hypothetical protein
MTVFEVWRKSLQKPLPRVLLGFMCGSTTVILLIFFFTPIPMLWKQAIAFMLMSPYLVGIPLIELCLLYRERRLKWFLKMLIRLLPMFVIFNLVNYFLAPQVFWKVMFPMSFMLISASLYGSWGGRMIDLGYFGDTTESEFEKH